MSIADRHTYLSHLSEAMKRHWPENRAVHIVCHGHSVPAGYFATPLVDTFHAYPHLLHRGVKARFPFAVVNVIVTAIGGEHAGLGAERFSTEVLNHRPELVTIDYALNDRGLGLPAAEAAWRAMITQALKAGSRVLLLTPTWDLSMLSAGDEQGALLRRHAEMIRRLADEYGVGLADAFAAFERYQAEGNDPTDLLSWPNHPNATGHALVARELLRWFPV